MRERTKAFLAGTIDGEGCFHLGRWWSEPQERYYFDMYLDITSKDRSLVKWIVTNFGGVAGKASRRLPDKSTGIYYNWRIKNTSHLNRILDSVSPYLFIKRPQADVIQQWLNMNGAENPTQRLALVEELKRLKREGVTTETPRFSSKILKPYLAAFFDGEGSISPPYKVACCNTHLGVLRLLQLEYGGSITADKPRPNCKPSFHWQLYRGEKLERFLLAILPYVITKRGEANILLDVIRSRKNKIQSELMGDHESGSAGTLISQNTIVKPGLRKTTKLFRLPGSKSVPLSGNTE